MDKRVVNEFKKLINNLDKAYQRESHKPKNTLQKIGSTFDIFFITIIMILIGICTIPVFALIIAYGLPRALVVKLFKAQNK
jgi:hypothetical protein